MPDTSTEEYQTSVDKWLADHEEIKGMLKLTDDAFATLSKINSWVGTAIGVLKLVGVIGEGPNPFKKLYDALDLRMQVILATDRAADLRKYITDIEEYLNKALSAVEGANDFIKDGRPADRSLEDEDAASREAVNALINSENEIWKHVFWPELSGEIPPPTELLSVWDYRWALPAALKAIAARLAVLDAMDPDHRETGLYSDQIRKYADKLRLIHQRITEGIKPSPFVSVTRSEMQRAGLLIAFRSDFKHGEHQDIAWIPPRAFTRFDTPSFPYAIDTLMAIDIRCGAVDAWSAASTISDWNGSDEFKHSDAFKHYRELARKRSSDVEPAAAEALEKYFELFASETKKRWLAVYDAVGLDALARIVTNLMLLAKAGEVPKSLREMAGAFEARHFPPEPDGPHVSLKSLLHWVGIGEKGSLKQLQNAALKEKLFSYVPEAINGALTRENLTIG